MKQVYLAGPEVFYLGAREYGERMKAVCLAHGFLGLFPLDVEHAVDPASLSRAIFEANCQLIDRADAVLANLRPFRGHEPDSGTVWEVSYARAKGKPVIGYMPPGGSLIERMGSDVRHGVDQDGNQVEDFGHPLNLMLVHSLTSLVFGVEANFEGLKAALDELQGEI